MPVQPTYPGVYIEEVPSPVRTIVGVSTSVTAFVGYTSRGPLDTPVRVLNYGDFERTFGGLAIDSEISYAVQQFFQNGGIEAYVVRVAAGADTAEVRLRNQVTGGNVVLIAHAASAGAWGNDVLLTVDHGAANPTDQFNLTVTRYRREAGALVPDAIETHANLSMNQAVPNEATATVNPSSTIVRLERPAGLAPTDPGRSTGAPVNEAAIPYADIGPGRPFTTVAVSVDGLPAIEVALSTPTGTTDLQRLQSIATDIPAKVSVAPTPTINGTLGGSAGARTLQFTTAAPNGASRSIRFMAAATGDASRILRLGRLNGGVETDGSAALRPAPSGTVSDDASNVNLATLAGPQTANLTIDRSTAPDTTLTNLELWGAGVSAPANLEQVRARIEAALHAAAAANAAAAPELAQARVLLIDNRLQVIPDGPGDALLTFSAGAAATFGLNAAGRTNVGHYRLGLGPALGAQQGADDGADGTRATPAEMLGNEAGKRGLYALENVDMFNLMCLPGQSDATLLNAALAYCERRRAFLIVDAPANRRTLVDAQDWIADPATPKSRNAAAYFPWVDLPDPLQDYRVRSFPPSGMLAGLYARTDGTRGVWKAPAGTDATLRGARAVSVAMTDLENGTLNPNGLNAIRSLPIYGTVAWGGRTLHGADRLASEWKYIPVRRLALFIEESLYRGTQWVVFEPNDEPLWSQIRLNVGAFMHNLFRQGAFQGTSPRQAYLVKCDSETTTQNDIDLGIVNIVVGFAPLKPAEFVILKIAQLAGQVEA